MAQIANITKRCKWACLGVFAVCFVSLYLAAIYVLKGEEAFYETLGGMVLNAFPETNLAA